MASRGTGTDSAGTRGPLVLGHPYQSSTIDIFSEVCEDGFTMTTNAINATSRLHCAATYDAAKAISLAAMLNEDEKDNGGDFTYSAEVKGAFARIQAFDADGVFVGYF